MNQKTAILETLSNGETYTMDQLLEQVKQRTTKAPKRESLLVHISNLRKEGYRIESNRADSVVSYQLKGSKGRKRANKRTAVTA